MMAQPLASRLWPSWGYSAVASSPASTGESPVSQPKLLEILISKRVRLVGASLVLILLICFMSYGSVDTITQASASWIPTSLSAPYSNDSPPTDDTKWSRFAYTQYVTNTAYLCNSLMIFESLHRLGSKADRLMMFPSHMQPGAGNLNGRLLAKAESAYGAKLQPITIQRREGGDGIESNPG
jgi:hypothetical protein